jgi:hypothetical protein
MSSGFVGSDGAGLASGSLEVVLQCLEGAVPVAGQRGQELLGHLHRG